MARKTSTAVKQEQQTIEMDLPPVKQMVLHVPYAQADMVMASIDQRLSEYWEAGYDLLQSNVTQQTDKLVIYYCLVKQR